MCRLLYLNASVSDGQIQGNNGREWRQQMKIAEDLEEEWPSNSTVLGLLVFSPCKPIISIRQEDNYMQCFHPLAKKIKCLYFRTGCGFFDEMLFCQKTPVSDLFAVPPGGLSGSKFRLSRWNFWQTWCSWLKVWFSSLGRFSALHSQPLHKNVCMRRNGNWGAATPEVSSPGVTLVLPALLFGGTRRTLLFPVLPLSVASY